MNQSLTLLQRLDQFSLSDALEAELAAADASQTAMTNDRVYGGLKEWSRYAFYP